MRRFRVMHVSSTSKDGKQVQQVGVRVGYWPCLKAPFVEVAVGKHIFQLWHGLPSYRYER